MTNLRLIAHILFTSVLDHIAIFGYLFVGQAGDATTTEIMLTYIEVESRGLLSMRERPQSMRQVPVSTKTENRLGGVQTLVYCLWYIKV